MAQTLYYTLCTEREDSWQRADGFIISDNEQLLHDVIKSQPKWEGEYSWEYSDVSAFMPDEATYQYFKKAMRNGVLFGENKDLNKLQ